MNDTPIYDGMNNDKYNDTDSMHVAPNKTPEPKVVAATVGAGVGSAVATVTVWIITLTTGTEVPEAVTLALGVIATAGLAFIGGYWKRA